TNSEQSHHFRRQTSHGLLMIAFYNLGKTNEGQQPKRWSLLVLEHHSPTLAQEQAKKELAMKARRGSMIVLAMALAVLFVVLSACGDGTGTPSSSPSSTQTPGTDTQSSQSGDIPDTQAFL